MKNNRTKKISFNRKGQRLVKFWNKLNMAHYQKLNSEHFEHLILFYWKHYTCYCVLNKFSNSGTIIELFLIRFFTLNWLCERFSKSEALLTSEKIYRKSHILKKLSCSYFVNKKTLYIRCIALTCNISLVLSFFFLSKMSFWFPILYQLS